MLSTFTGEYSLRARGNDQACSVRAYPCERPWRPCDNDLHRISASRTAYAVPGGFFVASDGRGLPLRWGLAFASLGELVRTSSIDHGPRGAHGGDFSFSAGNSPRNMPYTPHKTYRANKANKAQSCKSHASYRTNEAKTAKIVHTVDDFCLSWSHYLAFRAGQIGNAHHQSSNIK